MFEIEISKAPFDLIGKNLSDETMLIDPDAHNLLALWDTNIDRSSLESRPNDFVTLESDIS
jgi:hypothetical protein